MFPPSQSYQLDVEAISGICGSVSIACWIVVFSPQIIENFRRSSAEGLSIEFVIIWLLGDFANIVGSVAQKVLPTMIILAIYYTLADIVLLLQCFYYRGIWLKSPKPEAQSDIEPTETAPLLANGRSSTDDLTNLGRRSSHSSFGEIWTHGEHFSPVTPLHPPQPPPARPTPRPLWKTLLFNATAVIVVIVAGVAGYYLSPSDQGGHDDHTVADQESTLAFSPLGQAFGYLCAALYLGSRVPQLLLNHRRKSTDGLNALFFLFACLGNLTYVFSIFAFEPVCHGGRRGRHCAPGESRAIYGRYILVNLSWLIGSLGTLFLDAGVFVQFFMYRQVEGQVEEEAIET